MKNHQQKYYDKHKLTEEFKKANREKCKKYKLKHPFVKLAGYANKRYKNSDKIKAFDLYRIAKRQKLICPLSGRRLTAENLSIDHIVPKSRGGTNTVDNIRLTDKNVNISKNALVDSEFLRLCQDVVNFHSKKAPLEPVD